MSAKPKANTEAIELYAKINNIDLSACQTNKDKLNVITEATKPAFECDACGFKCAVDAEFCPRCGQDVREDAPDGAKPPEGLSGYLERNPDAGKASKPKSDPKPKASKPKASKLAADKPPKSDPKTKATKSKKGGVQKHDGQTPEGFVPDDDTTLRDHTEAIRQLDAKAGLSVFEIGRRLYQITEGKKYLEGGHETFEDYCKTELGYTKAWAYGHIRVFTNLKPEQAEQLGVSKAILVASAPEPSRKKLLKETKDGIKAASMTKDDINTAVKADRPPADPKDPTPPRKKPPKLTDLFDLPAINKKWTKDSDTIDFELLDGEVWLEVKQTKTGITVAFYPPTRDEDDTGEE